MRRLGGVAALVAAGAGLSAVGIAGITTWWLNGPQRAWPPHQFTPFEVGVPAEEVTFTAADGVQLAGWWFDAPESSTVAICCHGHRGDKSDMLGIGPGLRRAGHNVLLFDFRGRGSSESGPRSLAHHEQLDVTAAVDWVKQRRPDARIAVVAFSMGAATALLAAADDPRIEALVLDSSFATMADVVAANLRRFWLPAAALMPAVALVNRLAYGYAFGQVRPLDAVARVAPRPILLLHGTADRVIPYGHASRLLDAGVPGTVELVTFEDADHCGGYFTDRPGYIARVDDFLRRELT